MVTLLFDVKALQRSSDISENSSADFTLLHFYLRYSKVLYGNKSVTLFLFIIYGKILATHIWATKDDFFIMSPNPSESSLIAGCPLLQLTKLIVNPVGHLHMHLKNIKAYAQCRGGLSSVVFYHAYEAQ